MIKPSVYWIVDQIVKGSFPVGHSAEAQKLNTVNYTGA